MSLLDRYVGRIVAGAFGAATAFFLLLMVVMDLLTSLSKFITNSGLGGIDLAWYLVGHYLRMLPLLFTTITPFVTVIACMFSVSRLQGANEVVPMLFTGRSTLRVLRPMLICGALAAFGMAACWQWVLPPLGAAIAEDESTLESSATMNGIVFESGENPRFRLYAQKYDPSDLQMRDVNMLIAGDLIADNLLITAAGAKWDKKQKDWRLDKGREARKSGTSPVQWLGRSDLTPELLLKRGRETVDPETQSYTELLETIDLRPNRPDLKLALHRHITYPLANLILLLLALPFAIYFDRGSRIERLLVAIGLCGAYLLVDLTCQSLAQRGIMHPIVMAWTPTIVFGALGVVLFGSTKT